MICDAELLPLTQLASNHMTRLSPYLYGSPVNTTRIVDLTGQACQQLVAAASCDMLGLHSRTAPQVALLASHVSHVLLSHLGMLPGAHACGAAAASCCRLHRLSALARTSSAACAACAVVIICCPADLL